MNCLAHAFGHLDDPYFAAGTCVPDWIGMADRQLRIRRKPLEVFLDRPGEDSRSLRIASGILQHFDDDDRFHSEHAFFEICAELSQGISRLLDSDTSMRPRIIAHVLVELVLDSEIEQRYPGTLDRYYQVIATVDPLYLVATVDALSGHPATRLEQFIPRYLSDKFLYDYLDDRRLLARLSSILRRVRCPTLPESLVDVIAEARHKVSQRFDQLYR